MRKVLRAKMQDLKETISVVPLSNYEDKKAMMQAVEEIFASHGISRWITKAERPLLVTVKPNWIIEAHEKSPDQWEQVITHPALVLAVVENLASLMKGRGTICIADGPTTYADFNRILDRGELKKKLAELGSRFPGLNLEIMDLRKEAWKCKNGAVVERFPLPGDPRGYVRLDLAEHSMLYQHHGEGRYYGADYDWEEVNRHHNQKKHEYLISKTALLSDLFINLPKLKTHKKTGITCSLKNLVGVNGDKNWLPHFVKGHPRNGGDEYASPRPAQALESALKRPMQRLALQLPGLGGLIYAKLRKVGMAVLGNSSQTIRGGNWEGNDTCWRMVLDLNRALLYGNPDGTWREFPHSKKYLSIVDGIVAGQGNGPLEPDPVPAGVLIAGPDPAKVDAVAARLMGFNLDRLKVITQAFQEHRMPLTRGIMKEIQVHDGRVGKIVGFQQLKPLMPEAFIPPLGWPNLAQAPSELENPDKAGD